MIPNEFFQFFKQLEKNNSKEWFDAHRKDYERNVKEPFHDFVSKMIEGIRVFEPDLQMSAKDAIFRINRDIRFSTDKSPYKTHMGAHITRFGKSEVGRPGFYFEIDARGGACGGGCYQPDKDSISLIRDLIMHENKDLHKILKTKTFKDHFGDLQGEKNKILPAEYKEAAKSEPLLFNKQFFYWATLDKQLFTSPNAVKELIAYYKAARPMQEYLSRAFS